MKLTWYGHSAFELEGKHKTLIDPYISHNPVATVRWQDLKPDVIVVTHGHSDHYGDTVEIARSTGCKVIGITEIADFLCKKGIDVIDLNLGGSIDFKGVGYTLVPAVHSNSIEENDKVFEAGCPVGVIVTDEKTVYHAGDTALFHDMALIHELFSPEVALLPIGGRFTMDIKAAVQAVKLIKPKLAIPMHYNTWGAIKTDETVFKSLVEQQTDTKVALLKPGDSIEI